MVTGSKVRDLENDVPRPQPCDIRGERGVLTRGVLLLRGRTSFFVEGSEGEAGTDPKFQLSNLFNPMSPTVPLLSQDFDFRPKYSFDRSTKRKEEIFEIVPSPLVASRGEKNMRNIIQQLEMGEREQGGGENWLGENGEKARVAEICVCVCAWDECQNVAPPDEWNKGSEMESNYARSRVSSPAFRFLPDPLANIIRRIGRRTTFIKLRATARTRGMGRRRRRPRTVSITGFLGFRFLFRSSIKSMPPRSKTSASRLSSSFLPSTLVNVSIYIYASCRSFRSLRSNFIYIYFADNSILSSSISIYSDWTM